MMWSSLDFPVGSKSGYVHDIERSRGAGGQAPVEVKPEAHRHLASLVLASHHRLQRQVRLARVGEQRRVELVGRPGPVERGVDDAIVSEEADREAAVCGAEGTKVGTNEVIRRGGHRSTLSPLDVHICGERSLERLPHGCVTPPRVTAKNSGRVERSYSWRRKHPLPRHPGPSSPG